MTVKITHHGVSSRVKLSDEEMRFSAYYFFDLELDNVKRQPTPHPQIIYFMSETKKKMIRKRFISLKATWSNPMSIDSIKDQVHEMCVSNSSSNNVVN